jgi:AraC-like DNA-binding protein
MVRLGEQRGVDPGVSLRGSGLALRSLVDPTLMVRPSQELVVVENLLEALGAPPALGLDAGSMFRLSSYGIWGFALLSSPTVRSALEVALQFLDLTFAFCDITGRTDGNEVQLVVDGSGLPGRARRFLVERDLAGVQTIQRDLFAEPLPLVRVALAFPEPSAESLEHYRRVFGVDPQFEAEESLIAVSADLLDRPMPQANEVTQVMALGQLRGLLMERLARTGLAGQVRDIVLGRLGAPPTASEVASLLHLSDRTLRARLAAEGTSFRALLDEARERVAEELLLKGQLPVAVVSERLGYVEVSSFSQAFRRWKGIGPREWCRSMTAESSN